MIRLWVDGEDYGTMSRQAAEMFLSVEAKMTSPRTVEWHEVPDDSPVFLPAPIWKRVACWTGRVIGHIAAQVAILGIFALDRAARVFTGKEELS